VGRNSKYDPDFVEIAKSLCRKGAADGDLAKRFGVHVNTIDSWKKTYSDFHEAIKEGKDRSIERVENALYKLAEGGNLGACIFILCNRNREKWQNTQKHEHGGAPDKDGVPMPIQIILHPVEAGLERGAK